jgi:aspartokinase-like uncharacterized kinase
MWVVKLGGSLYSSPNLSSWLGILAQSHSLVIVPGGGPFADQVRQAQQQLQFNDASAHVMALLAMEQYGRMLCGLQSGLTAALNPRQIEAALKRGETPVWMPSAMVMADADIEQSWDVTSDSLAVWLCDRLGGEQLVLVKSVPLEDESLSLDELTARQIVDNQFGDYLKSRPVQTLLMAEHAYAQFPPLRGGKMAVGTRIAINPA